MLLSTLLNSDSRVMPDMAFETRRACSEAQASGMLDTAKHPSLGVLFSVTSKVVATPKLAAAAASPAGAVLHRAEELLPALELVRAVLLAVYIADCPHEWLRAQMLGREDERSTFFRTFAPFIIARMQLLFESYRLLQLPDYAAAVLARFEVYESARARDAETGGPVWPEADVYAAEGGAAEGGVRVRVQRPVNTPAELARFVHECVHARPRNTFKHIRMDPDVSPAGWRKLMTEVRADAAVLSEIARGKKDLHLHLTVFVDELNTTQVCVRGRGVTTLLCSFVLFVWGCLVHGKVHLF